MLELEGVTDPRLSVEACDRMGESPAATAKARAAVVAAVRDGPSRVVAIMPVEMAKVMMNALNAWLMDQGTPPVRPHPDYVPPTVG
jgi:hypothetical protein